jgi:hypothetical protein
MGILKAGALIFPLDPSIRMNDWAYLKTQPAVLITLTGYLAFSTMVTGEKLFAWMPDRVSMQSPPGYIILLMGVNREMLRV